MPNYRSCSSCGGSGHVVGYSGDIATCPHCGGDCTEIARGPGGRFAAAVPEEGER